jgi:hypothetical protein
MIDKSVRIVGYLSRVELFKYEIVIFRHFTQNEKDSGPALPKRNIEA